MATRHAGNGFATQGRTADASARLASAVDIVRKVTKLDLSFVVNRHLRASMLNDYGSALGWREP